MMRSLYSGVAGLKTHQTKMDVIGNNIANVNTTAYKSQSITFGDLLYQTTQAASGANANTGAGGTNARQIGLGSKTGAISTAISTQGSAQTTNNPFDIMITGSAFFVVSNGSDNFFTRDGSFNVDGAGNLVMSSTGYTVMGWQSDANGNIVADTVSALRIMSPDNMTYPPEATTQGYISGILDKNDTNVNNTNGKIVSLSFYDSLGYQYNAKFSIHAVDGDKGNYYVALDNVLDANGEPISDTLTFGKSQDIPMQDSLPGSSTVTGYKIGKYTYTDTDGSLKTAYGIFESQYVGDDGNLLPGAAQSNDKSGDTDLLQYYDGAKDKYTADNGYDSVSVSFDKETGILNINYTKAVKNAMYLNYDPTDGTFAGIGDSKAISANDKTAVLSIAGGNFEDITVDFSSSSMFNNSGTSTITAERGDKDGYGTGRKIGEMSGVSISKDGIISASYDNGQTKILGQIAVATFANAAGLEKAGDNLYSATMNSGEFDGIGVDITTGGGYMTTGVLEMSNVDLAGEFTEMITTQRGFQANSRIITTSDSMLEELVNLKR